MAKNVTMAGPDSAADGRSFRQSFAQQRLWFLRQLEPDSTQHNVVMRLGIEGSLDPTAMRQAFADMIAGHSALRTCYRDGADGPEQWVDSEASSALATRRFVGDLSAGPGAPAAGACAGRTKHCLRSRAWTSGARCSFAAKSAAPRANHQCSSHQFRWSLRRNHAAGSG